MGGCCPTAVPSRPICHEVSQASGTATNYKERTEPAAPRPAAAQHCCCSPRHLAPSCEPRAARGGPRCAATERDRLVRSAVAAGAGAGADNVALGGCGRSEMRERFAGMCRHGREGAVGTLRGGEAGRGTRSGTCNEDREGCIQARTVAPTGGESPPHIMSVWPGASNASCLHFSRPVAVLDSQVWLAVTGHDAIAPP